METTITTPKEPDALAFIDNPNVEALQSALAEGQLQKLTTSQRLQFLAAICRSIGLNPLTSPFSFITLSGRMVLYCTKSATDQLRKIHNVSIQIISKEMIGETLIVTARASMPGGRQDEDVGAVPCSSKLQGEALAMTHMKAITKAKRRVTLSICGLGFLDESEIADAQAAGSFSEVSAPTMPQQADVLPKSEPESIDVEPLPPNAEDESQAPPEPAAEETIDEAFLDLLTNINDSADAASLNACAAEIKFLEREVSQKAAVNAVNKRAAALGLRFNKKDKKFI